MELLPTKRWRKVEDDAHALEALVAVAVPRLVTAMAITSANLTDTVAHPLRPVEATVHVTMIARLTATSLRTTSKAEMAAIVSVAAGAKR